MGHPDADKMESLDQKIRKLERAGRYLQYATWFLAVMVTLDAIVLVWRLFR